ncbi:MAG: hypothetical protein K2G25_08755, partial [Oscillospiraceae bacterium]|nr:hypothetical protein [Oscillospiraceae bacterium]
MTAVKSLKLIIRHRCSEEDCPPGVILRDIETELTELTDETAEEILPEHAEHYVYHNINYEFYISGADSVPTKLRINDEN